MEMLSLAFKLCVVMCCLVLRGSSFSLTILHTNDVHSRFTQTNKYSGRCSEYDESKGKCYGGFPRLYTKVKELKQLYPNTVLVDAGDQYQGTVWFYRYGGNVTVHFMNAVGYDVMALGNHEFDLGVDGLMPLMMGANFSIVSSNVNASAVDDFQDHLQKSVVRTIGGEKVGFVGYTTVDTSAISNPGKITFNDEVQSVREEVERLTSLGVNKIVCLGHAGFLKDKEIARNVSGIDVIVGGHTNTFLYNGEAPSNEQPLGEYPTVVEHTDGSKVLVVQDYAYAKYLGFLQVEFNDTGQVTSWSGNPILLNSSIPQDSELKKDLDRWEKGVDEMTKNVVGSTAVLLKGEKEDCRLKECSMGNLVTDAMVRHTLRTTEGGNWNDVAIGIINGGGIRQTIEKGDITLGDVMMVLPFRNTIDIVEIRGSTLLKTLNFSVSLWDPEEPNGGFVQVSGIRVVYDVAPPEGKNPVREFKVRCADCAVPAYVDVDPSKVYKVVISSFLASGGDKYSFLPAETIVRHLNGDLDMDVVTSYIKQFSPIVQELQGRIRFVNGTQEQMEQDRKTEESKAKWEAESSNNRTEPAPCSNRTEPVPRNNRTETVPATCGCAGLTSPFEPWVRVVALLAYAASCGILASVCF